jgi:predicted enzyme related to lactoylglutathione lyase
VIVRAVTVMVLVEQMDRAIRFYRDTLGLTLTFEQEDWAMFGENVGLMLSPEPLPELTLNPNAVMLTLTVDDAHGAYHELVGRGVVFVVGPTDVGGAIVASFRDTEGNVLQLLEPRVQ